MSAALSRPLFEVGDVIFSLFSSFFIYLFIFNLNSLPAVCSEHMDILLCVHFLCLLFDLQRILEGDVIPLTFGIRQLQKSVPL